MEVFDDDSWFYQAVDVRFAFDFSFIRRARATDGDVKLNCLRATPNTMNLKTAPKKDKVCATTRH